MKNKCILKIKHKKVIEYSIEYSLSLGADVTTVVSTDIENVITDCKESKIECIRRDAVLCEEDSRIEDALFDALERFGTNFSYVSLVYGNVPTRYPELFHEAISFLDSHHDYDAVLSMQNVEKYHPESIYDFDENILPRKTIKHYRRQTLPQKMIHDGHTVVIRTGAFYPGYRSEPQSFYSLIKNHIKPMINTNVIFDIDTEKDYKLAKAYIESEPDRADRKN